MGKSLLPPLDYCFYCRKYIGEDKQPHLCEGCLELICGGKFPVSVMFQDRLGDGGDDVDL